MVHKRLVPQQRLLQGGATAIRCAHGDTVLYPLAQLQVEVEGKAIEVEAAVSETLPMSVLLGTDIPELPQLLQGNLTREPGQELDTGCAYVVTTRAAAKKQQQTEFEAQQRQLQSGVQSKPLEAIGDETAVVQQDDNNVDQDTHDCEQPLDVEQTQETDHAQSDSDDDWITSFDDDMFGSHKERQRLTRKEKHENREKFSPQECDNKRFSHALDMTASEFSQLQQQDPSLVAIREAAKGKPSMAGVGFFERDGLVYRRWIPRGRPQEEIEQLVVPAKGRPELLRIAHTVPLAGHMGKEKTAQRLLQRFYWPTLYHDVAEYCQSCPPCQKSSSRAVKRAPLVPLPIIDTPFKRIAMDIIGPLPRSKSGKKYILVVCDYATRYPEAIPLKTIDAAQIAEELLQLFARVGIPEEILTDQGSNFTSQLLMEIYSMLHVHPIRTTLYHPQTDSLVERFNQTLKKMLRKAASQDHKDWDKLIPYLLFAYREVPQSSTGFSPFELLYGRSVRGPLDVIRDTWTAKPATKPAEESVISHVLTIR